MSTCGGMKKAALHHSGTGRRKRADLLFAFRHCFFNFFREERDNLRRISDNAVIRDFKNRGGFILVHGDDDIGFLHAGKVLNCTGNAAGEVEVRADGLSGLADLNILLNPARVDAGSGRAHRAAERVRAIFQAS